MIMSINSKKVKSEIISNSFGIAFLLFNEAVIIFNYTQN